MHINSITEKIIGAAIEVHKELGPGLLESAYKQALAYELKNIGLQVKLEVPIPVKYKNLILKHGYRADMIIEEQIVIEIKAQEDRHDIFKSQILTNTRLSGYKCGLLLNFYYKKLVDGIIRVVF